MHLFDCPGMIRMIGIFIGVSQFDQTGVFCGRKGLAFSGNQIQYLGDIGGGLLRGAGRLAPFSQNLGGLRRLTR